MSTKTKEKEKPSSKSDASGKKERPPRGVDKAKKEGLMLLKGVRKFLRYNRDLITDDRMEKINSLRDDFGTMLDDPKVEEKAIDHQARDLTRACEVSVPDYKPSILRENIEVVFVAFVIAMGIRAYFLQPFKIPTGSMQPTLNGITGHIEDGEGKSTHENPDYEHPNLMKRLWARVWNGHKYVNIVAAESDRLISNSYGQAKATEMKKHKFLVVTVFETEQGRVIEIPAPEKAARQLLNPAIAETGGLIREGQVDCPWLRRDRRPGAGR